jgi:hypothetical protein
MGMWLYSAGFSTYPEAVEYLRNQLSPRTKNVQITYFDRNGEAI